MTHRSMILCETQELEQFLLCCFNRDPAARWSAKQLMGHPWLRNATAGDTSESSNDSQTLDNLRATLRARNTTKLEALPDTNSPEVFSEFISALHAQPLDLLRYIERASSAAIRLCLGCLTHTLLGYTGRSATNERVHHHLLNALNDARIRPSSWRCAARWTLSTTLH